MTKIYQRDFDPDSGDSLALVAKHIPPQSRVLDIGCGAGDLGQYLREAKQCYVVGLEYSEDSIAVAQSKLDDVKHIDLNEQMPHHVVEETFDVIVMADILEHIYTPDEVMQSAEKLLKSDGKCLISIPNAGYVGALISLYDDTWEYREEGILDCTHIRFYTQKSVMTLLTDNGFDGVICDRVIKDLTESEFNQRIDSQADAVRDWLLAKPEGATYQFIVEARPQTQQYAFPAAENAPPMALQHVVKLYWQDADDKVFDGRQYGIGRGEMGQESVLSFAVDITSLTALRLDFADRRGVYRIASLKVFDGEQCVWSSQNADYTLQAEGCLAGQKLPTTCLAHDETAFLLFIVGVPIIGESLRVEVQLHAPIDALNTAFIDSVPLANYESVQVQNTQIASDFSAFRQEAEGVIQQLQTTLSERQQHLDNVIGQSANERKKLSEEMAGLVNERNVLLEQRQQLIDNKTQLENEVQGLVDGKTLLVQQLAELRASSSWKITAPLRKITKLFK